MFFIQGVYELTPTEITTTFAPILNSIEDIRDRLREEGNFLLFYFRGQEQKTSESMNILKKFVLLAKNKGLSAGQWNSKKNAEDDEEEKVDYFEEKYEIDDNMGIIMYRDHKYLTCLRDICEDDEDKFKLCEKVLTEYSDWPVRPSPKEYRIARENAAKAAAEKATSECCIIL